MEEHADGLSISRHELSEIHPALRRNILSRALESLSDSPMDIESVHVNALETLLAGDTGTELDLPKGIRASLDYENLLLTCSPTSQSFLRRQESTPIPLPTDPQAIAIPGETLIPGWKIIATIEESIPANRNQGPYTALFDLAKLPGPITVRRRREGDRFTPLGMSGSKKLQDFLTDAKVPRTHRDSIPIVLSGDQIIWLVGQRPL